MSRRADHPDSPRSWAIAAAAFVINILLSGISRTTGLFYVALIDTYGASRMEANMPFTLRNIVRNLLGPVVGAIGHRYGAREVTIAGGFFASIGISLCAFAPNVWWISLFWGGVHGIGVALGNTLFQVVVNQYFEKHRATASGFAFSGGCVGSFTFPIVLEYMLTHIGLFGTFLVTGALTLHVVPAGLLMKEPTWLQKKANHNNSSKTISTEKDLTKKQGNCDKETSDQIFAIAFKRISSTHDINSRFSQSKNSKNEDHERVKGSCEFAGRDTPMKSSLEKGVDDPSSAFDDKHISIYQGTIDMCCDPMFHLISLSLAAFVIQFDLSLTIIVDYLKDKGFPEESGKYFICLISAGDFVGRLGFGWVTDRNYVSVPKYICLLHVIQGLSFCIMPLFESFESLMATVVLCGLAGGAHVIMFPILVAKYLPSVQSLAFGCISFLGGIMAFGVPPMIGYFRDTFGSYDSIYYIIGGLSTTTGLCWLLEPLLLRMKGRRNLKDPNRVSQPSSMERNV